MCRKIEEKRGVVVNEVEPVSLDVKSMALSGPTKASVQATGNGTENSSNWDSDWGGSKNTVSANATTATAAVNLHPNGPSSTPSLSTVPAPENPKPSTLQQPPLSFEWPPPSSVSNLPAKSVGQTTSSNGYKDNFVTNNHVNGFGSTPLAQSNNSDADDPFANWPLPTTTANKPTSVQSSWSTSGSNVSSFQSLNNAKTKSSSIPPLNANEWTTTTDWTTPSAPAPLKSTQQDPTNDLGKFFSSPGRQETALKLAPPPPSGLGKGRGRNPIRPLRTPAANHTRSAASEQPSLLDLL